jgi:ribosomal protein S18 acetylase RimI-like enzyme
MDIQIREIDKDNLSQINCCDNSFLVENKFRLHARDEEITYSSAPARPFLKSYPPDELDYSSYIDNPEKTIFFAYCDEQLAGQIILRKNWNGYAYVEDIAVDSRFRRQGIGKRLMVQSVEWAKSKALTGIMLETSNVNIAACQFYERFGFKLGGFDRFLYKAVMPGTEEVAMYWYLVF